MVAKLFGIIGLMILPGVGNTAQNHEAILEQAMAIFETLPDNEYFFNLTLSCRRLLFRSLNLDSPDNHSLSPA
jgi:hypothetical protein